MGGLSPRGGGEERGSLRFSFSLFSIRFTVRGKSLSEDDTGLVGGGGGGGRWPSPPLSSSPSSFSSRRCARYGMEEEEENGGRCGVARKEAVEEEVVVEVEESEGDKDSDRGMVGTALERGQPVTKAGK